MRALAYGARADALINPQSGPQALPDVLGC